MVTAMSVVTFEARADLSRYLAELQKGEKALHAFVANAAAAPAALHGFWVVLASTADVSREG